MVNQLIIRGQKLDLPKTPLRNSLEILLLQRGFKELPMDFSESSYEASKEHYKAGKIWNIRSNFINDSWYAFHNLEVYEYRLFKDPVDILNAQFFENIFIKKDDKIYLEIGKITYSMYSKIVGLSDEDKSKLHIQTQPQEYEENKVISYVNNFIDFLNKI